ncbi:MAG TPA: cell surface protein SprA, partial [Candidatus Eisenbacteria bacterium]|nr:cell surface protein SprA [Candidatus Eisenbacteria bacterium]
NQVYIDDMEGVRDAVSLSLTPDHWRWSSVPSRATSLFQGRATSQVPLLAVPNTSNAEIHWFTPPTAIKEKELRPNLTDAQGGQNPHQALALSLPRHPVTALPGDTLLWAGLTYVLDQVGIDLSRSQFIDLWVNDRLNPWVRGGPGFRSVKLHLDLGEVSEDQMRAPNRPPDGILNTEDLPPRDNQLTVAGNVNEDTGYDGLLDSGELAAYAAGRPLADLVTADPNRDPEGDDFGQTIATFDELDPRRYVYTNGTEGNKDLFPFPDTEDLNLNGTLDTQENYFEYTVDLADTATTYLETDVRKDFPGQVDATNGWRRYRIPLADSLRVQFGTPDLTIARHVRVWLEGVQTTEEATPVGTAHRPMLVLGGLDIVGSRWQTAALTDSEALFQHTTVTLNSVNTVDNAGVYVAPFDPGTTRNGSQELQRREQSLALEFTELAPTDTLEAFRTFSIPEDYTRYRTLSWYAAAFDVPGYDPATDSLDYFVRFASDVRGANYYELLRRLPRSSSPGSIAWETVEANLADLARFKLAPNYPRLISDTTVFRTAFGPPGDSLVIKGSPSFTRLLRISIGVVNRNPAKRYPRGQLWFDELRATNVAKDAGFANRVLVNGKVANLATYNLAWNHQDANFLSVGQSVGSGTSNDNVAFTSTFEPYHFFEGTGILLPL